jgi:hypothetical protein
LLLSTRATPRTERPRAQSPHICSLNVLPRKRRPRPTPSLAQSGARESTGEGRARPRRPASPLPRGSAEAEHPGHDKRDAPADDAPLHASGPVSGDRVTPSTAPPPGEAPRGTATVRWFAALCVQ